MLVQIVRREIATQHIHSYGVVQYRKHLGKDSSGWHPQEADLNGWCCVASLLLGSQMDLADLGQWYRNLRKEGRVRGKSSCLCLSWSHLWLLPSSPLPTGQPLLHFSSLQSLGDTCLVFLDTDHLLNSTHSGVNNCLNSFSLPPPNSLFFQAGHCSLWRSEGREEPVFSYFLCRPFNIVTHHEVSRVSFWRSEVEGRHEGY